MTPVPLAVLIAGGWWGQRVVGPRPRPTSRSQRKTTSRLIHTLPPKPVSIWTMKFKDVLLMVGLWFAGIAAFAAVFAGIGLVAKLIKFMFCLGYGC